MFGNVLIAISITHLVLLILILDETSASASARASAATNIIPSVGPFGSGTSPRRRWYPPSFGGVRISGRRRSTKMSTARANDDVHSSDAAADADTNSNIDRPILPRRLTLSGGGVPEINAAVSSDEAEILESRAKLALAQGEIRGGAAAAAAASEEAAGTLHRQHMISSLAAGVGSGVLASCVCAPLDLIRTRMQVMGDVRSHGAPIANGRASQLPSLSVYKALADIVRQDGIRGCFRGLGATLATVPAFWGLYFPLYEHLKKDFHHRYDRMKGLDGESTGVGPCPPIVHMGAAITAGAASDIVCNPLFLIRTRIQTEALHYFEKPPSERVPHGIVKTIQTVYGEGGIPAFWRGLTASLLGLGHVAIQFPVYEFLKSEARANSKTGEESPADLLLASGVSKMCASLLTYPHEVIRSRMMDARGVDAGQGALKTIARIMKNEGWTGMYTGIHVSLLRVVPNCCITFMSYELILRWAKEKTNR
mmetsp:Transcript_32485/g.65815  ORF Transcript_32485/g.65815 Transcript_32485/m.65815 type:complete len:481 (+) Transcript_32485:5974-7416(+)